MKKNELLQRLLDFDKEAYLRYGDNLCTKHQCYIVGGGALLILNLIPRATNDIDIIHCTERKLIDLMKNYNMNMNVKTYIDCFPDNYFERAIKLDIETQLIDFYILSIEDLVVSKLSAGRDKDFEDIQQETVINSIKWDKLEELIELAIEGKISDYDAKELNDFYNDYKKRYKK